MDYQFNVDSLSASGSLSKNVVKKLIADVQKDFPNDSMMQELHLRRYVNYEKHLKSQTLRKRKVH